MSHSGDVVSSFIVLVLYAFGRLLSGGEALEKENTFVKADVVLEHSTMRAGDKGTMVITLTPADGIHINADPAVEVSLEKNSPVRLLGNPDFRTDKESGFLATSTPLTQRFSIPRNMTAKKHTLKGTLVYYFCSDSEGWCRKFSHPIALTLNIIKR